MPVCLGPKRFRNIVCAVTLAFASAGALAESPDGPPPCSGRNLIETMRVSAPRDYAEYRKGAALVENGEGLLWRIERRGIPASYLFGTMHVTDPDAVRYARSMQPYLKRSKIVATELGDTASMTLVLGLRIAAMALFSSKDELAIIKSPEDRAQVELALARRGMDPAFARRLEPWILYAALSAPQCEMARQRKFPIVDDTIVKLGKAAGVPVAALETVSEQLSVFETIEPDALARMIVLTANIDEGSADRFSTLVGLYKAQAIGRAEQAFTLSLPAALRQESRELDGAFLPKLLDSRNIVMRDRSRDMLAKGRAFIAVGALHLVGRTGLVALYRQEGYRVTRVR